MRLTREIRFSVGPPPTGPVSNSWAGWPAAGGVQPYLVLQVSVQGKPDPTTGYLCDIRRIDQLLRERTIPLVNRLCSASQATGEVLLVAIATDLLRHPPPGTEWSRWRLHLTPFLHFTMDSRARDMVQVTQSFEFAAAHRLHCPTLSDQQNQELFGKCNNPNGHGHNYRVDVTIEGQVDAATGVILPIGRFEQLVKERVIDRLDHRHLNRDCPEFAGLNPSVENILNVIWSLLDGQLAPARLRGVRVYETAKTWVERDRGE